MSTTSSDQQSLFIVGARKRRRVELESLGDSPPLKSRRVGRGGDDTAEMTYDRQAVRA